MYLSFFSCSFFSAHGGTGGGGSARNVELAQRAVLFVALPQPVDVAQHRTSTSTTPGHAE